MLHRPSVLISLLRDALRQVELDSALYADDPDVLQLKRSILHGIAELELLSDSPAQLQAAA